MNLARRIAADIGVDRLCWEITDHPEDAFSRRFVPGSPALDAIRRETWDDNNLGNAIPGATPSARIDVRTLVPGLPLFAPRRPAAAGPDARAQPVDPRPSRPRPPTAAGSSASARSSAPPTARSSTATSPAAELPRAARPAATPSTSRCSCRRSPAAGSYALKFDLVSEGVDWFERCGSETTTRSRSGSR